MILIMEYRRDDIYLPFFSSSLELAWASLVAQWLRICLQIEEAVSTPGSEKSPGEGMTTHSSILAWEISWTQKPGGLVFVGSQRVGHK